MLYRTVTVGLIVLMFLPKGGSRLQPTSSCCLWLFLTFFVGPAMILGLQSIDGCWLLGETLCFVCVFSGLAFTYVSTVTVVLISVDRYIAICQPLYYNARVTVHRTRTCISLTWLYCLFFSFLILKDQLEKPGSFTSCAGECVAGINYYAGILDLFLFFIFPISAIIVLYTRVFIEIIIQIRSMRSEKFQRKVLIRVSELKAASTLGVVVLMFLVCLCPYYFVLIDPTSTLSASKIATVLYLVYANSC